MRLAQPAAVALVFILACTFQAAGQEYAPIQLPGHLQPDSSFTAFSDSLSRAISEKDTSFIFGRVSKTVMNGFGYNSGKNRFRELWRDPYVNISGEMNKALRLGAAFDREQNRVFVPSLWLTFPDSLDPYRYGYGLYGSIPVYKRPDGGSPIVGRLGQTWVRVFSWFEGDTTDNYSNPLWVGIRTARIDSGYVEREYIRSPIDYRFWFEKTNGRWTLMGWAAGD